MSNITTIINKNHAYQKVQREYPHILLDEATNCVAVLVSSLAEGDTPLYVKHNGVTHCLNKRIDKSATNLAKLIKVYPITICISPTKEYRVTNNIELLELGFWWKEV